ncbi:Uncharacterised protein [uncultured archaeon]|nr:Uncharacterised protein [uncultured archaeon]
MPIMRARVNAAKGGYERAKALVQHHLEEHDKHERLGTEAFMRNDMSAYVKHIGSKHRHLNDRVQVSVAMDAAARELWSAKRERKTLVNAFLRKRAALKKVMALKKNAGRNTQRVIFAGKKRFLAGPRKK